MTIIATLRLILHNLHIVNAWISNFWHIDEAIQTYTLLERIAQYIHETLTYCVREEPGVQSAKFTLASGTGSCRDFSLLFMEAVRCLGLACRFVSGYLYAPLLMDEIGSTHAWAEVYLPGAGWKGFDLTIGKIAGTDHIEPTAQLPDQKTPIELPILGYLKGFSSRIFP
jgi:transglutaminase-like putative cysteine protease